MSDIYLPQGTPLTQGEHITTDWYIPLQQLTVQALTFTGTATPGDTVIFVSNTTVTTGPPSSAITDSEVVAWLGL